MKVYVLLYSQGGYERNEFTEGVFTSEALAIQHVQENNPSYKHSSKASWKDWYYEIEEHDLKTS